MDNTNSKTTVDFRQKAAEWLKTVNANLTPSQATQFIEIAAEFGLNPFKREIYGVPIQGQLTIITGYLSYLKRAERSGLMDGWEFNVEPFGDDLKGTLTIYRKDWQRPFKHVVFYSECYQTDKTGKPNTFWTKRPKFMLEKCAIAQGFRICFPDEFSGMPYMAEEMPTPDEEPTPPQPAVTIATAPTPAPKQLPTKTKEEIKIDRELADLSKNPLFTNDDLDKYREMLKTKPHKEVLDRMQVELDRRLQAQLDEQENPQSATVPF